MSESPSPAREQEGEITLTLTRRFAAPRARVFEAWANPDQLAQWFGPKSVNCTIEQWDARPGGSYSLTMHHADGDETPLFGEFREIEPPQRLVFTWQWSEGGMAGRETLVTLEFEDAGEETVLHLNHALMPDQDWADRHRGGWNGCFDSLDAYFAT